LASYKSNVQTFAGVGFKTRAEIFREIIYNDKVVMAGESFTCKNDVRTLDHDTPTLITSWSNSESSLLDIVNSTKVEKVISFDDFVDYAKKEEIFSGSIFGFESKPTSVIRSDTSSAETGLRSGDVTGSQSRFGEIASSSLANANFYFFLPEFGLINTDTAALKIYKVEKIHERAHPNLFNNTAVLSYDSSDGNFKVGGKGNGYISYDSTTKGIGVTFNIASSDTVTFTPSSPVMYQEVPTGFEANKFYLVGAEDLADGASNDAPEVLYQKLVYPAGSTTERYYPFLRDRLPQFDTVNYELGQGGDEELQLHAPYLQSYIFGRDFAQFVENRLRGTLLDKIKISKLSNSGFAEDTAIINTGRFFSLINSTFMYYTILINKKFNGQWGGWEISEKAALAGPEKITDTLQNAPTKIRVFDGSDLSSSIEDMQYKIATSSDSYYTVNYPHLINIIEEKQPVLVNTMEDERLYFVDGYPKLETMDYLGVYNSEQASFAATGCFGNFDEYFIKPDEAAGGQFLVSTCYDPWEIEANRVYKVAGHDNDKIEYNGRIYDNGALITGKSLNSPNTLASDPISRTLMPVEEYQLRQAASPQPWMFSNEGVYSEEVGYKKLTPLLYKKQTGDVTLELNKRYVLYNSPDTTATINSVEYNATDEMIPSNQFIGHDDQPSYSGTTVRQKFEDGQTLLPGVEYFVYGQGQITYPDSIVTDGAASVGDSVVVSVVSVPSSIQVGQIFEFGNGAELIVKSWVVGEITGEVRNVGIESGASAPIIVNIFSSDVVKSAGDLGITGGDLAIVELPQDFFRGEVLVFSGGGVFVLSENAYAGDIVVKGDVIMGHIGSGEEAKIVDYKELKTKTITASGNFSTSGESNTFKGLKGFSRVGGKLGGAEILTAAASGSIKKNFLYKVFGSGSVTYNDIVYNGENVIYGDGNTYSISVSVREIIDPYDVKAGDVIYAYGAPTVNLFEYLDASEDIQYITENNGASTTWSANYSSLKVHKVPYTSNDFDPNQPTITSSRIYGIEPGVTYTIESNDLLSTGNERRAVVKYAKDIGSCTKKDGTSIDSSKYHNKFDCTRRDVLVVDFGGPDYDAEGEAHSATTQYTDSDKVEHGDYRADGVKFRVTADFLAHYADNVVLKASDVLEFSKGGKFILSEDIDLDDLTSVAEEGETRYYGTMKGIIPFGYSLYHFEFCPVLNWSENFKDFYYTSDRTVVTQNTTNGVPERIYVGQGEIEVTTGDVYRVEAGVEIVYNGVIKTIGEEFNGVSEDGSVVDSWVSSTRSNGLEYITRANKTDTEFVGVAGRPFLEIIEGNPKIFVKGEGPMDDGSYIVEGGSVIYSEDYTNDPLNEQSGGNITDSYFHDYCGDGPNVLNEHFSKYLAGSYSAGVITAGAENSFMIGSFDSDAPYKNGCWLYDSTKIPGTLITVASPAPGDGDDLQLRNQYASPIGISEAQDYVDSTDHSDTWSVAEPSANCFLVTEGFLGFSLNKDTRNFPEVVEKGLPYKETGDSTLFDLSDADGFEEFQQNSSYLTAVVFGAGDFGLHHYDTSGPTLHETTNYKAYGNLDTSSGAIEGKAVTSIEEDYMYKVETGTIKYRDKLLVIDNELGYCGVDAEGKQVVFHNYSYTDVDGSTTLHNRVLKTDSFKNDLYLGINVKRLGKLSGDLDTNDFLVFESEIEYTGGKTYAVGEGPSIVGEELSSRGIEVAPLPVGLIKGEILFFCSSTNDAVTSITKDKFYCVRSGSYAYTNRVYGPYGFSRFFLCTGSESVLASDDVVEVSILELSHERNAGAGDLYGTISQSALEKGYKCIRQVSIKIDDLGLPASCKALTDWDDGEGDYADGTPIIIGERDTKIWGRIADPLYYVAGTALYEDEIPHELYHKFIRRSLTNGQVLDRVIRYTDTTYHGLTATYTTDTPPVPATGIEDWEKVYSEYTEGQRFKGTQDTPSWRTVSGTPVIRYSNTINYATDLFWRGNLDVDDVPTATTADLCGEYLSGQPKILFVLDETSSATIGTAATDFPVRYYYYDLDYGKTSRSTLTLGSNTTEGSNNFFVGDGGENAITINDLLVKTVTGTTIKSSVLVGKVVVSGEIEGGKDYFVWGTGSIVYDGIEIGAYSGSDIDSIKDKDSAYRFSGTDSRDWYTRDRSLANYEENPYIRKSWDRTTETDISGTQIPKNKAKFYVARPMVFEIVTITDGVAYTTEAGAVYYVFGEGSITYINKQIFATNKYIAVATDTRYTSDNKIIPSGAISYGGKMIASYGDQYDLRDDFSFSPISPVSVWTYAALLSGTGKRFPTLSTNEWDRVYVYRKVHGSEALASGKKYYVFGRTDFISYKQGDVTRQYFPRGQGREDIVVKGDGTTDDDLTISGTSVKLESGSPNNDFTDLAEGSEITVSWTDSGEVYYATRTIATGGYSSATDITVDSAFPASLTSINIHSTWQGRNPNKTSGKVTTAGTFTVGSAGVKPNRFLLGKAAILRQGYSCCIRTKRKRTVDGSGNPTTGFGEIERHGRISYKDIYGTTSSDKKIPLGTYVVRGRGEIIYPVFKFSSEPDEGDYAFVDGDSSTFNVNNVFKHKIYSKTFMAGDVFFAIELPVAIGLSVTDGGDAPFYYKTTGQERVYRIPDDYKKAMEDNSMDQFLDMAPAKYGVNTGELLIGETYEVFYKDSEGNVLGKDEVSNLEKGDDIIAGNSGVYVTYQIGAGYGGPIHKSYRVGEEFTAIPVKDDGFCEDPMINRKSACLAAGKNWRDGVKGGVRLVREFHAHKDLIVRAVEGIRKCAPAGAWSNEWSMFLTSTHHHPSRTSTWHHDYYGDVMGFLNQRCHIFSEDFKLGMYRHLLDTFSYGIKPVIRSEAPPGHIYLEGSNASQEWFYSDTDQEDLNRWFYSSCQIYKPDYYIESVTAVDYIEKLLSSTNVNDGKDPSEVKKFWNGICTKCQWQDDSECALHNRADCELAGGTWVKAVDLVKVRLNRRLTHTPNTAFRSKDKKISSFTDKGMLALWHAMGAGPFTPEVYRTDENAVVDYLIREKHDTGMWRLKNHGESEQRKIAKQAVGETVVDGEPIDGYPKIREEDKLEFETADGKIVTNEKVQLPCHKARIGDAAPDIFIWQLPDDPFGACEPRFYFTKHIPYVHDDNRGIATKWTKTPVTVDPFIQMEQYLRGFCGGFVDKESDPKNEEITEVDIPTGTFDQVTKEEIFTKKSLDPTCYKSKDYDYLFENLSVQSLEGVGKTLFKDYSDVTIKKTRIVLVSREFDLPNPVINLKFTDVNSNSSKWDLISRSGARGYRITRKTRSGYTSSTAGTVKFKIIKLGNKWVLRFKRKFIDEYSIKLTGSETVPYNVEYEVTAIDARGNKIKGASMAIYTGQADMLVLRDSQSKAVIKFTPSYCSDPSKTTKGECLKECKDCDEPPCPSNEEDCEKANGSWVDTGGIWSPVKYFLLERKRSRLPHYTEWLDHDLEIDVINQSLIQIKKNKRIKKEDRPPSGQFEINDLNLRREEDSDPLYAGVSKDYEIKIFAYFRHLPKGKCISEGTFPSYEESELLAYSKGDCLLKAGTWKPNNIETDNSTDDFEKSIKVPAYFKGMKNPFEVAKFLIRKDASGRYYIPTHDLNALAGIVALSKQEAENLNNKHHAWVITDNEGVFKIRFRNLVVSALAPIDSATRKEIPVLRNSKGYKVLFYDIKYRVKIGYDRDNLNESTTRRSPWEKVRRFSNASSGKEVVYHDNKNYKNENVNYRVTKVQTTNATSRWISPLMLEDELTGHPDSRKGYGPLPNIKLSAHVFNQFANAINLLNEARLDLPIRVQYRYHTKFVAQPSVIDPSGGLGVHKELIVLNVPPPTMGTYSWRGHTCHPVSSPIQDRYEYMVPFLGADPSSEADFVHTDAWGDENLGLSVIYENCYGHTKTGKSDWYFESGHSWFCADKNYGFLNAPLLINDSTPFIAKGGMASDTELKIAGNQLAFSYAVPDILRSRTNPDDLILSGAMYETEIWTPELRRLSLDYRSAREAGLDESQVPDACRFDDQTGFSGSKQADHFLWMSANREENEFVKFVRKEKQHVFCKDISGTFIMKAPPLRASWAGIIIAFHKTGSEYNNVCIPGGMQSSLCFSTRASSGDNNMRIKLPLKDKFGPWTQCQVTKPIKTKTKKTTKTSSKEDEDTMVATASDVGPDSGRAREYQVTLADGAVVDVPGNVEDLDYILGDTGNALLPGKLERVEGRDKDGKLVFCEGTSCPPLEG